MPLPNNAGLSGPDAEGRSHLLAMAMGSGMMVVGVGSYVMVPKPVVSQCVAAGAAGVFLALSGFMIGHANRERGFQIAAGTTMATAATVGSQLSGSLVPQLAKLPEFGHKAVLKVLTKHRAPIAVFAGNLAAGVYYTNKVLYAETVPAFQARALPDDYLDPRNKSGQPRIVTSANPNPAPGSYDDRFALRDAAVTGLKDSVSSGFGR